jgi:hypothetical protein
MRVSRRISWFVFSESVAGLQAPDFHSPFGIHPDNKFSSPSDWNSLLPELYSFALFAKRSFLGPARLRLPARTVQHFEAFPREQPCHGRAKRSEPNPSIGLFSLSFGNN